VYFAGGSVEKDITSSISGLNARSMTDRSTFPVFSF
jgi:hypothetical protein